MTDVDTACKFVNGLEEYFANIINNTAYVPWETVNQKVIGPSIQAIGKKLDEYPNFELISPMHYNENNVLKLTIEGAFVKGSTNCETFERMPKHSKLILRTLFRWIFNKRFADIISRRFMLSDLGVESYRVQSVSSIIRFTKDYTQCLKNDFFRILHKLNLNKQLTIVDEIRKILSPESTDSELRSLSYLSYSEVHLDKMVMNFKEILKPLEFADFVENVVFTKLFTINRNPEFKEIEERKEKLFGSGIEVLRYRLDTKNGSSGYIRGISVLQTETDYDIFILFHKSFKKYSLYKCLFNRLRQVNGYKLVHDVARADLGPDRREVRQHAGRRDQAS